MTEQILSVAESPQQAVKLLLDVLRETDSPEPASLSRLAGPRTLAVMDTSVIAPLLQHTYALQNPMERLGDAAAQVVHVQARDGRIVSYRFELGRYPRTSEFWRTESITVLDALRTALAKAQACARHFLN
jgi:hypothetical protein